MPGQYKLKDKIAVCSRSFSKNKTLRKALLEHYDNVKFNDDSLKLNGDSLIDYLADCDGAIVALEVLDEYVLSQLPKLKYIGKYGVGLDKLDFDAMERYDVRLGWTPGVNSQGVAELTIALSLIMVRNIDESNKIAKCGRWRQVTGKQISSFKFGILGCGHVGKKVAKMVRAFGCTVLANDIRDYSSFYLEHNVEAVSLERLVSESDIVSIHLPKNHTTENIINAEIINKMKEGSFIINTARGGLVDEEALLEALNSEKLAGVALDVLEQEPPVNLELINHNKAYVTTHIGGSSEESILSMGYAAINGLKDNYKASRFLEYK